MTAALGRLTRRAEFLRVAAAARKWATPGLILQSAPILPSEIDPGDVVKLGFTCSRRVGNAVERNRARRRLKAAAAQVMPEAARQGYDYVLIGRTSTLHRPYALLVADLELALRKVARPAPERSLHDRPAGSPR